MTTGARGREAPDAAWERARAVVLRHGWNATSYQLLNPGIRRWLSADGDAVVGWARHAGVRVVAGAPVCAAERLAEVAAAFEADARAAGERVCYFGAGARLERETARRLGADARHAMVLLGAQPVWDPREWGAIVRGKASLRAQLSRATNKGVRVREWPAGTAHAHPALHAVLASWLATRGLPTLHFMVEPDTLALLRDRRVFVAERERAGTTEVLAFLVATPVPAREGWLVEQWPRRPDAPNGTTHLLVDAAMRAVAGSGAEYVTLGLAPLSSHAPPLAAPLATPLWLRATLRWVRAHGHRFYNFAGLDAFKAGMRPAAWEPIYAIAADGRFTPRTLYAIAGVFGQEPPVRFVARALATAARREVAGVPGMSSRAKRGI